MTTAAPKTQHTRFIESENILAPQVGIKDGGVKNNMMLLKLTIRGMSFTKKVNSHEVVDDIIDARMVGVTKSIIGREYLSAISSLDSKTREQISALGFRPHFIGSGFVLIPIPAIRLAEEQIKCYKERRSELVTTLSESIEQAKSEAETALGHLFNPMDYPTPSEVVKAFSVEHNYSSTDVPSDLEEIDRELFLEQQRKAEAMWKEATVECQTLLRTQFAELVESMHDKVSGLNEGKVFKSGFIENMKTFFETFDLKNVTGDTELKALVDKAREVLNGETPSMIRSREDVRIRIEQSFTGIKQSLDSMTKNEGRAITL